MRAGFVGTHQPHFTDAGRADAVVELEEHTGRGDEPRVNRGSAPGAADDADADVVAAFRREPPADHLVAPVPDARERIRGIARPDDHPVAFAHLVGPHTLDVAGGFRDAIEGSSLGAILHWNYDGCISGVLLRPCEMYAD